MKNLNSSTDVSLLAKLRSDPTDQKSWDEFVDYYGGQIFAWAVRWGLQPNDAQDMTQDVLVSLAKQMKRFEYKPGGRFRSWLKTIAYRAWIDFLEARRKSVGTITDSVLLSLMDKEARHGFLDQLDEAASRELMEIAMRHVEARVEEQTWAAFRLTQIDALPPQDVAEKLGMKVGSVYVARSRIRQLLLDELEALDAD